MDRAGEASRRECEEECGINDLNFQWGTGSIKLDNLRVFVASTEQEGQIVANPHTGIYEHEKCEWLTFEKMKYHTYKYLVPGIWWAEAATNK